MKFSDKYIKAIHKEYMTGVSTGTLGKKHKCSSSGLRLRFRGLNLKIRDRSLANSLSEKVKRGKEHFNWNGGFSFHRGQVYRNLNRRRVKESHYQWCIANHLLQVPKGMIIHHRDLNSRNNNLDNLIMTNQSMHAKIHAAIENHRTSEFLKNSQEV